MGKDHLSFYESKFYVDLKRGSINDGGVLINIKIQK